MKYIYNHLGLGDHIICNGLYRELISQNENYSIFVKNHNVVSVSFMIRDLKNINIIPIKDDQEVLNYILNNNISQDSIIKIGFCQMPIIGAKDFDDSFYLQHQISFEKRWTSFKCERDFLSEKKLFDKFDIVEGEYIFLHDDKNRGFEIDESFIVNKNIPIIRPVFSYTENIFDYCYLMEKSRESHFIDSSFRLIFDSLKLRNDNIFFHINLKNNKIKDPNFTSQSILNFTII